ncbi:MULTISPECIES: DUF3304 domain-containing protein [pseudomallei group]|uniref:DUF3304 domain-containing protein n=1 Tax=pseudomallei group TaxID=111527 RepID=UPI0022AC6C61|nr:MULTISPECIES: DUF3304 domain-containing protein [pseudomallei group]MCZ2903677.1 DUF3304 domain-containing protein [Burkholderia thailandensis]MDD1484644.1 DUF3304 domain-containing protein [Burkholderia thailandensis]MDD1490629.1 DUF3304 domain-containing protein [Burkholderia thailandensis]MDD1496734.1 DUF3304 domain-containing protein [Burkholderia thailandensis]MDN7675920.1 DUF3304 domain-containing protein [Burkholderia oklahomensis]
MIFTKLQRVALAAGFAAFALTACASSSRLPDDPLAGKGPALAMVPVSHADRYAVNIFVDKYWAGDVEPHGGGGGAACCFPGVKDWSKPVTVTWTWDAEEDPKTKAVTVPEEKHSVQVNFPPGGPHQDTDWHKTDAYLCVILRDRSTAALAFSPSRSGCVAK